MIMTTEEGNKLIAEFMEFDFSIPSISYDHYDRNGTMEWETRYRKPTVDDLEYHSSFDWLMPVVEKIASLGYFVEQVNCAKYFKCRIWADKDIQRCGAIIEDSTWLAVIQFIQWYNTTLTSKK